MSSTVALRPNTRRAPSSVTRVAAWGVVFAVSLLPNVVFNELLGWDTSWLFWAKVGLLAAVAVMGFVWQAVRPLQRFMLMLLALLLLDLGRGWLPGTALWQGWFGAQPSGFVGMMLGDQLLRVASALLMIGLLVVLGIRPVMTYLGAGRLDAPVKPIRWLGIKEGEITWARFGWMSGLAIGAGTLVFLVMGGTMQLDKLPELLRLLPAVLLFAVMNAFAEEVSYRSTLFSTLRGVLGEQEVIFLTAAFFGMAHYYGVPYGVLGVLMSTFLGWLLGKSMMETQGLFWPWAIHFIQDVLIFSFIAAGSIVPGG